MLVIFTLAMYEKTEYILHSRIFTAAPYVALSNESYVWIKGKNVMLGKNDYFMYSFKK